jgi:transposase-like protein
LTLEVCHEEEPYTKEFREETVRLTVDSGKSVAQVARDLGISVLTPPSTRPSCCAG